MKLAPGVPAPDALGVAGAEELLAADALERLDGAERLPAPPGEELVRYRLPGTPGPDGRRRGRPAGAGTGTVLLRRFSGLSGALLRARCTRPRSASLGERTWNALCALRAEGVGTPEPMAVGAAGRGLVARASFVVTRDLEDLAPLARWAEGRGAEELERGREALLAAVARLAAAGVDLPRAGAETVYLSLPKACGADAPPPGLGPARANRLPGVVFADVGEARFGGLPPARRRALEALAEVLGAAAAAPAPE